MNSFIRHCCCITTVCNSIFSAIYFINRFLLLASMEFRAESSATKQNTDLVNYFMSYSNKMTITKYKEHMIMKFEQKKISNVQKYALNVNKRIFSFLKIYFLLLMPFPVYNDSTLGNEPTKKQVRYIRHVQRITESYNSTRTKIYEIQRRTKSDQTDKTRRTKADDTTQKQV